MSAVGEGRFRSGFTLVEVMITIAITGTLAGATYALLSAGTAGYEATERDVLHVDADSKLLLAVRGEISRASQVTFANGDSLSLQRPDGREIAFSSRARSDGIDVIRYERNGGSWRQRPLRPLATVFSSEVQLDFSLSGGLVVAEVSTASGTLRTAASPWVEP